MVLTPDQNQEMFDAAKPLMKLLAERCHPHCEARVTAISVDLLEAVAGSKTYDFVTDEHLQFLSLTTTKEYQNEDKTGATRR